MDIDALKDGVRAAQRALADAGLLEHTWGSLSAVDRDAGVLVIKTRGTDYTGTSSAEMAAVNLESGAVLEGEAEPNPDLAAHALLYKRWDDVGAIVHTHAPYATSWAQACLSIPCLGVTHADYFYGEVPLVRPLSAREVHHDYELNLGRAIIEHFAEFGLRPLETPAALVPYHGAYAWGRDCAQAVRHTLVLERVARLAYQTILLNPRVEPLPRELQDRHFPGPRADTTPRAD